MDMQGIEVRVVVYEAASVGGHFLTLPRDLVRELEEALAAKAGKALGNNHTYEVTDLGTTQVTAIKFTDEGVLFGRLVLNAHGRPHAFEQRV